MCDAEVTDRIFMSHAIAEARKACTSGEVPVGAVVVLDGEIVGRGCTRQIAMHDPTAHAELIALRDAANRVNNYRIVGSTMYVTLEPCMMCAGALIHARIERLVYGCRAPKTGVVESHGNLLKWPSHNHIVKVTSGVCADECAQLLSDFFIRRRKAQ